MNLAVSPYLKYKQNAVQGANPGQLTLMLYNGLVKFINLGIKSIEEKDIKGSHDALVRAQEIVAYLNDTLDMQYELSSKLASLYEYMLRRLVEANAKKDGGIAAEVLELAGELRETWQQAIKSAAEPGQ